jgi:uncharacterized protein (TIGR03083 family)
MEIDRHIDALEREGLMVADLAEACGPDVPVPTCPGWQVRDLVKHLGYVHRWAARHVAEGSLDLVEQKGEADVLASGPSDDALLPWFRDGHAGLVVTLRRADPDVACFSFLPAPSPLAFWCRRQAHETAVHRADADAAAGRASHFDLAFAADGIDELVMGFAPTGRSRPNTDRRRVLLIRPTDADDRWLVGLGPDGVDAARGEGVHDGAMVGPADALYLVLWNRLTPGAAGVEVQGEDLAGLWSSGLQVRWRS